MARSMALKRNFKNIKINKNKDPLEVNEIRDLVYVASAFSFLFLYAVECSREREGKNLFSKHTHVLMETISNSSTSSKTFSIASKI